jgi:hypothetical protein
VVDAEQHGAVCEEKHRMFSHILGVLMLAGTFMFGGTDTSRASIRNQPDCPPSVSSAPELDPTTMGSGIAMLIGGVLVLNERRRKHQ